MATCNFNQNNLDKFDLPLIVWGIGEDYEIRKQYFCENVLETNDTNEYTDEMYNAEIEWATDEYEEKLSEINDRLEFFEVIIEGGYYQGYQFNVKEIDSYNDYDSIQTLDDEDADYFYGKTACEVKAQIEHEIKLIREWLNTAPNEPYVTRLVRIATFNNGEAVYKKK